MSPRGQKKTAEVEVTGVADNPDAEPGMHLPEEHQFPSNNVSPEEIAEAEDFLNEPVNQQEFNEFIAQLARNAAQQEIAELDGRVRDLELLTQILIGRTGAVNPDPSARPVVVQDYEPADIPDYSRAHQQDDGVPWYQG